MLIEYVNLHMTPYPEFADGKLEYQLIYLRADLLDSPLINIFEA